MYQSTIFKRGEMSRKEKEIRSAFDALRDNFEMPHPGGKISQNGLLWLAEEVLILNDWGFLRKEDQIRFKLAFSYCWVDPGPMDRHPTRHEDQEGPDDYWGVLSAAHVLNLWDIPRTILAYGQTEENKVPLKGLLDKEIKKGNLPAWTGRVFDFLFGKIRVGYNYNNKDPGVLNGSSFLGRQLPLVAHMKLCSGQIPGFWLALTWFLATFVDKGCSSNNYGSGGQDRWRLTYLAVKSVGYRTWWTRLGARLFFKALKRSWGSMKHCRARYFVDYQNPWAKYLRD